MTAPMRIPSLMLQAIKRTLESADWAGSVDDPDRRMWLLLLGLCAELHPLGEFSVPSVQALNAWLERDERDERIRAEFNGQNYEQLARKHRLSTRQVRRIVDDPRRRTPK